MKVTHWTVLLVAFISIHFAIGTFWPGGHHRRGRDRGYDYSDWSTCGSDLRAWLGLRLGHLRSNFDDRCRLGTRDIDGYQMRNVWGRGFNKFGMGDACRYHYIDSSVSLHFSLRFEEIEASCELFAPESFGFGFGNFAKAITRIFDHFTHAVLEIVVPNLLVEFEVEVRFDGRGSLVKNVRCNERGLDESKIKSGIFLPHSDVFQPFFRTAFRFVFDGFFAARFKVKLEEEMKRWTFQKKHFLVSGRRGSRGDEDESLRRSGKRKGRLGRRRGGHKSGRSGDIDRDDIEGRGDRPLGRSRDEEDVKERSVRQQEHRSRGSAVYEKEDEKTIRGRQNPRPRESAVYEGEDEETIRGRQNPRPRESAVYEEEDEETIRRQQKPKSRKYEEEEEVGEGSQISRNSRSRGSGLGEDISDERRHRRQSSEDVSVDEEYESYGESDWYQESEGEKESTTSSGGSETTETDWDEDSEKSYEVRSVETYSSEG